MYLNGKKTKLKAKDRVVFYRREGAFAVTRGSGIPLYWVVDGSSKFVLEHFAGADAEKVKLVVDSYVQVSALKGCEIVSESQDCLVFELF